MGIIYVRSQEPRYNPKSLYSLLTKKRKNGNRLFRKTVQKRYKWKLKPLTTALWLVDHVPHSTHIDNYIFKK